MSSPPTPEPAPAVLLAVAEFPSRPEFYRKRAGQIAAAYAALTASPSEANE